MAGKTRIVGQGHGRFVKVELAEGQHRCQKESSEDVNGRHVTEPGDVLPQKQQAKGQNRRRCGS
jgi:hypothetical protein